jgi:hypothetical protein
MSFKAIVITGLVLAGNIAVAADDYGYYQFKAPVITEISTPKDTQVSAGNFEDCNKSHVMADAGGVTPGEAVDMADVFVDKIINLGKKIWAVVELGRPVVNVKVDTANALPKGIFCWADLAGWTPTQSKTYQIAYENLLGEKVVEFAFRVIYTTGGNYKGVGKYITNTTIVPAHINVAWGYNLNAKSEVPTVFNAGSTEMPVAGMNLNMQWKVDTAFRYEERAETFYVGGDGTMKHLKD